MCVLACSRSSRKLETAEYEAANLHAGNELIMVVSHFHASHTKKRI